MKNKALTYVLLGAVAIIWFQVFVRFKSNFTNEETNTIQNNNSLINFNSIERDTFKLLANYRDPFGSASELVMAPIESENFEKIPKAPVIKREIPWPKITYYGLVRKIDSNNPLGIINIDGMLLHLRKGETIFDDIKIVSVGRDSLIVKYKKTLKTFSRD